MALSTIQSPTVAGNFLEYLESRLGVSGLRFSEGPTPIDDGWETYIYSFQLIRRPNLSVSLGGPLILRVYSNGHGLPRLHHEFAVQQYMRRQGYPVPEPILIEEDNTYLGGPFMVMRRIPGQTLLRDMMDQPWRIILGPGQMAAAQVRLHNMSTRGFPALSDNFRAGHLDEIRELIADYDLHGLLTGLEWLHRHIPVAKEPPCIIHLDFHPINMMFLGGRCRGILDWAEADLGDRHADVAATLILIKSAPVDFPSTWQRYAALPGRWMLYRRYLRAYRRLHALHEPTLSYYMAWAALRRLGRFGRWIKAGPWITGSKPSSLRFLSTDQVNILRRCFQQETGLSISL